MVPITVTYNSELRCTVTHDTSGVSYQTDAPKDNFGKGESFSPTDLVATALGSCMITTIGIYIAKNNLPINIDGTTLSIEKHMSADLPRRIAKIIVRVNFPKGILLEFQSKIKEIGDTCPVAKSLHPDVILDVQYNFSD